MKCYTFQQSFKHQVIVHCFSHDFSHFFISKFNKCIPFAVSSLEETKMLLILLQYGSDEKVSYLRAA